MSTRVVRTRRERRARRSPRQRYRVRHAGWSCRRALHALRLYDEHAQGAALNVTTDLA